MTKSYTNVLKFVSFTFLLFLLIPTAQSQTAVSRIYTDWKGYWTSAATTGTGNQPNTENNLLGFTWSGTTYSTGVNDATLTTQGVTFNTQKFRALKIQSLNYGGTTYFIQGSMIDGSATGRVLTPALSGASSTPAELASRLTDGPNGLSLGTGIANIATNSVEFKVGTNNLNLAGLGDGVPDLIVTQVAQPGGPDVFKFVDALGNIVGNSITVNFGSVPVVGNYLLDLFNANNGSIASGFSAGEVREIRLLGYDTSAFGINASNAAQVDRFIVGFSGNSDCAFIAFNANSLKKAELSLVKKATVSSCGVAGDIISYTFEVTNTGDVPITNVTVSDPLPGIVITGTQGVTLAVGQTTTLTGTYTLTAADIIAGKVTNQAKVTGLDPSLSSVEDLSGSTINDDIATVTNLLTAPTGISGTTTICTGSSTSLTVIGGNAVGTGATTEWFANSCGGVAIGTGASISVAPTSNTTYYVRHKNNCNSTTCVSVLVTVNPMLPASVSIAATPSGAICAGTSVTFTATPTNGGTSPSYQWQKGGTNISGETASTYTSTTLTNADVIRVIMTSNASPCLTGSPATSNSILMTVNALPTSPVVGTITPPNCTTQGSVALSGLPASGTLYRTGTSSASIPITGTSMTVSGLASGTYQFYVNNGTCPSSSTGNVVISSIVKTWNGTWSPAGAPTSSNTVIINANYNTATDGNINACSVTVNSGSTMTISSGYSAIVQNHLTVNGTLNVQNAANLVMVNDSGIVSGTGTTNVTRTTSGLMPSDYVFWSTPVSSTSISATFTGWKTGNAYLYNYSNFADGNGDGLDDNGDVWVATGTMIPAIGCIIKSPSSGGAQTVTFSGQVNNGIQTVGGIAGSCLVGNPYPSAISADNFISENAGVIEDGIGFWTHNTGMQLASTMPPGTAGSGVYAYTSDDYAMYTLSGGTAAGSGGAIPSGNIGTGQGFFVKKATASDVVFNNAMRINGSTPIDNSYFFKTKESQSKKTAAIEKNRVWLNLTNNQGAFKQTLVGYIGGATNGIDALYDATTLDGNDFVDFYSINQDRDLVIQGRALPFDTSDEVPLGYKSKIAGEFKIGIAQADGLLANQSVYLEDKLLDTEVDLKNGDYTFSTEKGTFKERFVLKYNYKTLGTSDFETDSKQVIVSVKNRQIRIDSKVEAIAKIAIYDVAGKLLFTKGNISSTTFVIPEFNFANQVLIVKTILENGNIATEKIIY